MIEKIENDLKEAMKASDKFKTSVLRMLKSALQSEKINKKSDLTDNEIIAVIKKQVKVRSASKEEYLKYGRDDLADNLDKEIAILKEYLPEELSEEEIDVIIDETLKELECTSIKDMGKAMKTLSAKISLQADMGIISKKIKEKLTK